MSTRQLIMSLTRAIKISTCLIIGLCLLFSSCTTSINTPYGSVNPSSGSFSLRVPFVGMDVSPGCFSLDVPFVSIRAREG